mgnify:CR=1 FL=1
MTGIELYVMLAVAATGIVSIIHLTYLFNRDSKEYRQALKEYREEVLTHGRNGSRTEGMGTLQSDRSRESQFKKCVGKKK